MGSSRSTTGGDDQEEEYLLPLFETKQAKGLFLYRLFSVSIFIGICLVWAYRLTCLLPSSTTTSSSGGDEEEEEEASGGLRRWAWIGLFAAEIWFGFYWIITQSVRWNRINRNTFKHRLTQRFEDKLLPGVDIFVCTADPMIEPPLMVINTVLSVMAYDYPPDKLSVYLSDDGGSDLTFYALLEASHFSKYWIPFCKRFKIQPRSPAAYFSTYPPPPDDEQYWSTIKVILLSKRSSRINILFEDVKKIQCHIIFTFSFHIWVGGVFFQKKMFKLYEEMKNRIETATKLGRIPEQVQSNHKGFREWASVTSKRDHQSILQILIDGRDSSCVDDQGCKLPTLVYLAREKRPQHHHNFKAGAMNALIRVSSNISNGEIILNVDCDMYSNNSESVRDALCFLMDEEKGHEIAFVQFPQNFNNVSKKDIYGGALLIICQVELPGVDANGGPLYIGSGCFHRREILCGKIYNKESCKGEWKTTSTQTTVRKLLPVEEESVEELEQRTKVLATCTYEENTQWGKEMGLMYGCPVEDVMTGFSIQCRGWKSVYYNPERWGFVGVAPNTLVDTLVQHKRWSQGDFQIFLSKYNPFWYGHGKISLLHQMSYGVYCLWAPNSLAVLYYLVVPPLCLLKGIPLFPKISSLWFLPFIYLIITKYTYSLMEFLWSGGTLQGWWHGQRIWMFDRTTSYFFAFLDAFLHLFGFSSAGGFVVTAKVADEDVSQRYEKDMLEFGNSNPMFYIIATLALLNLFSLFGGLKRLVIMGREINKVVDQPLLLQIFLSGALVLINLPVYQGMFFRRDKGRMPTSLTLKSVALSLSVCIMFISFV